VKYHSYRGADTARRRKAKAEVFFKHKGRRFYYVGNRSGTMMRKGAFDEAMVSSAEEIIPQANTPFCWAFCLGDCSTDHSREHILTKSMFPGPQVSVEGFPFQRGQTVTLHKNQFSSNILCRYHNNSLSSVDQAGTAAFEAFKNAASDNPRKKNRIRGELFERWLLKTFINFELLANFGTHIPPELVEIAFGRRPFLPKSGLFFVVSEKSGVVLEDRISFIRLHDPSKNDAVPGGEFIFGGFPLVLALGPIPTDGKPIKFQDKDGTIEESRLMYHPARFNFHKGNVLIIDWRKRANTKMGSRRGK
jgi:hypothetical protein